MLYYHAEFHYSKSCSQYTENSVTAHVRLHKIGLTNHVKHKLLNLCLHLTWFVRPILWSLCSQN